MPDSSFLVVYDPQNAPIHTLASFRAAFQSPPGSGVYPGISNLRWGDDGILTARGGSAKLTSTPIQTSDSGTSTGSNTGTTLKDTGKAWTVNTFAGAAVIIDGGTGSGQTGFVVSNTSNTLTLETAWGTVPDATSTYKICAEPRSMKAVTWQGLNGKILLAAKDWVTHKTSVYLTGDPTNFGTTITPSSGQYGDTRFAADASGHDYPVRFAILSDRLTGKDVLVMNNGYDNPRIYDGTNCAIHQAIAQPAFTDGCVSRVKPNGAMTMNDSSVQTITNSADSGTSTGSNTSTTLKDTGKTWTVNAYVGRTVKITSGLGVSQTAVISSNTSNTLTISPAWPITPDNTSHYSISTSAYWTMDWYGGAYPGSYLVVTSSAVSGLSGAAYNMESTHSFSFTGKPKNIIFTVQAPTAMISDWLANFKIEVHGYNTAAWYTIHDPTYSAGFNSDPTQIASAAALALAITHVLFPMDTVTATAETIIDGFRMTPIGATAPAMGANLSFTIYGINCSGQWPGGTNWAVADYNSASRAISPSLLLVKKSNALISAGMSTVLGNAQWPVVDQISYDVDLFATQQSAADAALGVDTRMAFAQLTGEVNPYTNEAVYSYVQSFTTATYSGSWSRAAAYGSSGRYKQTITGVPTGRQLWLPSPSDFVTPIPIGRAMTVGAASRLLVGARHEAQDSFPRAALGEGGNGLCFRFASAPNLDDPVTSYEDRVPSESWQNFIGTAASNFASPTIYGFTDASLFMVEPGLIGTPGFLRRISSHGLIAPDSVAEHNGTIWYLDINLRIQMVGPSRSVPISLGLIDDKLLAIPTTRSFKVGGFWYKDRYYMPYTPSGGKRNTRCLVFSENAANSAGPTGYAGYVGATGERGWESDDAFPGVMSAECVCVQRDGNTGTYGSLAAPKILMIGQDMNCYQYETGTTDLGGDVAVSITTGDLQGPVASGEQQSVEFGRLHLITDAVNKTMTGTYTYKVDGGTATVAIILSNSSAYDWVKSKNPTVVSGQGYGVAGSINLAGNVAGGTKFYGMRVEVMMPDQIARMTA